jgi:hypothetical protein
MDTKEKDWFVGEAGVLRVRVARIPFGVAPIANYNKKDNSPKKRKGRK